MIKELLNLGCGVVLVSAVPALYADTSCVFGLALITAVVGMRAVHSHHALFTLYVNRLIKSLNERCREDGYLSWLSMDDTVIFATIRQHLEV